jgi:amidase
MAIKYPGSFLFPPLISVLIIAGIFFFSTIDGEDFTIEEATIEEIRLAFTEDKLTSRQLVDFYLDRIETLNPLLHSVVEINPDARDQADEADRERTSNRNSSSLGELHGIPVLLKDTIATKDKLNTTAGSYALLGSVVPRDAGVVERLRTAGAVILGKASLTEWYSFRALGHVPNGWCARAGQAAVSPLSLSLTISFIFFWNLISFAFLFFFHFLLL